MSRSTSTLCASLGFVLISLTLTKALHLTGEEAIILNSALENLENSPYYENQEGMGGNEDELESRFNLQQLYKLYKQNLNQNDDLGSRWGPEPAKRAPSGGFYGVRGKKAPDNGFYGVRGKKAPDNGFYGVRGKKLVLQIPAQYYQQESGTGTGTGTADQGYFHGNAHLHPGLTQGNLAFLSQQQQQAQNMYSKDMGGMDENKNKESADATSTNNGAEAIKRAPSDGFMGLRGKRNNDKVIIPK